jgi:glutamine cyclotransferase
MKNLKWIPFLTTNLLEFTPHVNAPMSEVRGQIVTKLHDGYNAFVFDEGMEALAHEAWFLTLEEAQAFVEDAVERS